MSWATNTASSHFDLLARLVTFLTTDTTLVGASQNWTAMRPPTALPFTASVPNGRISFGTVVQAGTTQDAWPNGVETAVGTRIKIAGNLSCPTTGTYDFVMVQAEWAEVRIDGALVGAQYSNSMNGTYPVSPNFSVALSSGSHTIDVRLIGITTGNRGIALGWKKPGDSSFTTIPTGNYSSLALTWAPTYGGGSGNSTAFTAVFADVETVLRGPGLAGTDQIFIGLNTISNVSDDYFNIAINGLTGYVAAASAYNQPGISANRVGMLGWNQPMTYWFIANGRRFTVIAKVSTVYESLHGGFLLPYGLPTEYPYPLVIGASSADAKKRFSDTSFDHSSFWRPSTVSSLVNSNLSYRDNTGAWRSFVSLQNGTVPEGRVYPVNSANPPSIRTSPDGSYGLTPITLYTPGSTVHDVWGELDGVFHVPGFGNASENVITISSQDYLVIQSGFRTTQADYAAIALA